jgi:hypothetical protein
MQKVSREELGGRERSDGPYENESLTYVWWRMVKNKIRLYTRNDSVAGA